MEVLSRSLLLVIVGTILLRISGRKSVSQMTIVETVVMISIGTIIVGPIGNQSILSAVAAAAVFIAFLLIVEYVNLKFDFMEKVTIGKAVPIMENGQFLVENMKKMRITVDQVEASLRQKGISRLEDVKTLTLEINGEIGYELQKSAQPLTMGDLEKILLHRIPPQNASGQEFTIFDEVRQNQHPSPPPENLQ